MSYYPVLKIEDQRYAQGHVRRRLVHSQPIVRYYSDILDNALSFPVPKNRDTTVSIGPRQNLKSSIETIMRSSGSGRVLVIMAKAPRPGEVKTRLASSLSPTAATSFDRCLLHDTLALARSLDEVEVAIMCPDSDVDELAQLADNEVKCKSPIKGEVLLEASIRGVCALCRR